MKKKTKRLIAVLELIVVIPLLLWFFCPRTFSWACGQSYDRAGLTGVSVTTSAANQSVDSTQTLTLTPGSEECDRLLDLLESRRYVPLYSEEEWDTLTLSYVIDIELTTEKGICTVSFSADSPIHFTDDKGERIHDVFRVSGGDFQKEVLALVMELNGTPLSE